MVQHCHASEAKLAYLFSSVSFSMLSTPGSENEVVINRARVAIVVLIDFFCVSVLRFWQVFSFLTIS